MSLVENFLLVFLVQDFAHTPRTLLGASVAVMCLFEVPIFMYIGRLWTTHGISLTTVIVVCQLILVVRCLLHMLVDQLQMPWLVLLVEPLHGVTFAAGRREKYHCLWLRIRFRLTVAHEQMFLYTNVHGPISQVGLLS